MPAGYRPCSFLVVPKELGKRWDAEWRAFSEADESKVAVAYLQHRVALAVRAELGDNAPALLARRVGTPWREDYFRRRLNGQIPLNLTELMEFAFKLGCSILPLPRRAGHTASLHSRPRLAACRLTHRRLS
ncbi:MAG: hypothetical protein M0Z46_09950 [Actinomycetota bacterium]|nr:hypothetical protein [Actinomycetota bacterium]